MNFVFNYSLKFHLEYKRVRLRGSASTSLSIPLALHLSSLFSHLILFDDRKRRMSSGSNDFCRQVSSFCEFATAVGKSALTIGGGHRAAPPQPQQQRTCSVLTEELLRRWRARTR
eukprot:COSAG02_NODE_2679_length_8261_cov_3.398922_4_plen_115_part_00